MKLAYPEIARLCRELAGLLHAGITLEEGAYLLAQEEIGEQKALLDNLAGNLAAGAPLSVGMEESGAFPQEAAAMAAIGEQTGKMEDALLHLAGYYEERCRTARQIKQALAYPSLVFGLMLVVVAVLLIRVLPVFQQVYASLGGQLTGPAAVLLQLGILLKKAMPGIFAVLICAGGFALACSRNRRLREKLGRKLRSCFGDRGVLKQYNNARFIQGFAMGISSGLTLEEAVELSCRLMADIPGAARRGQICTRKLQAGEDLSEALQAGEWLPGSQCRILAVGLRGGNGDRVLEELGQRLEEDAQAALEDRVSRVEPAMVLVASALVGLILLSVMLPLVDIMSTIG